MKGLIVMTVFLVYYLTLSTATLLNTPPLPCDSGKSCAAQTKTSDVNGIKYCCLKGGNMKVASINMGTAVMTECTCVQPVSFLLTGLVEKFGQFLTQFRFK